MSAGIRGRAILLALALALPVVLVYARSSKAYYCSYDDFWEVHRAAFEDTREPLRIFTTSHYDSYKYRPFNRLATHVTHKLGGGRPEIFRVRNLIFHVVAVWLVYVLGRRILGSVHVAAFGALLFGLHPLANQSVNIAVTSYTMAHSAFLASLLLFLRSLRAGRSWWAWLAGGLLSGWVSLLLYDTSIVVFGLMGAYLALAWMVHGRPPVSRRFVGALVLMSGSLLGVYVLLRSVAVAQVLGGVKPDWPSPGVLLRNIAVYAGALLLPVDPVLAREWWGTPLPSDIRLTGGVLWVMGSAAVLAAAGAVWLLAQWIRPGPGGPGADERLGIGFLLCAIVAPLVPVLVVTSHPSESYVYLPVAFYALLLSYALDRISRSLNIPRARGLHVLVALALLAPASAGTWVRNERTLRCGATAERIMSGLPWAKLRHGDWTVLLGHRPGRPPGLRYGHYNFTGLDTINDSDGSDFTLSAALQVLAGNDRLRGEILQAGDLVRRCTSPPSDLQLCWWVDDDGTLEEFSASGPGAFQLE
jgi:hypothetical protein